jgi:hypothetical protein
MFLSRYATTRFSRSFIARTTLSRARNNQNGKLCNSVKGNAVILREYKSNKKLPLVLFMLATFLVSCSLAFPINLKVETARGTASYPTWTDIETETASYPTWDGSYPT